MSTIAARYSKYTRLPLDKFTLKRELWANVVYRATVKLEDIPDNFCSVASVCVSKGELFEVFSEEQLIEAEAFAEVKPVSSCQCGKLITNQ
ncbi:hypothetical protein [Spirosoma sp.]|uniref:hypothetical protein n=1 Tax=Spirosoma sp. TaxID=1899569 RepID=UPI00261D50BA|nr:hypothetical protein [Spirosoma sp.]MCX6218361.1 hypothetical protein [Spirosoma sp.]